jgi:hypothetical protein
VNPEFIDNMSWEMAEVYGAVTDQILINLARRFKYFDASTLPRSGFAYQAKMLAQMGQVNGETVRIIRNNLDDADDALIRVLEEAIIDSVHATQPDLWEAVKKGVLNAPTTPVLAPNQMQAFRYYYRQSADRLNLVNTVMLESTQQAYQTAVSDIVSEIGLSESMNRVQMGLDSATGEVVTGVSSWNQAIRHATDKMKDAGIVGFVDHGGHRWSAEAYAAMDIRTTVANTARAAVWETNQNFGNDLYLVSYHNGARPLCYPWQNKVISSLDRSGVTYDLDGNEIQIYPQSSTSYGEPAGLFGINCKHYPTPFIPGVSVADGQPQNKEENDKAYAESQEQRRLERKLREEKRDLLMAKAQGAPQEEINALREKCRNSSQDIDDFCKSTGRARHRDREAVYTKRDFPDADKYDPAEFVRDQQKMMDEYRKNGGAQTGNKFGVMTPKVPIIPVTPPTPPTPAPVPQNVAPQVTPTTPQVVKSDVQKSKLEEQAEKYGVERLPVAKLDKARTEQEIIDVVGGGDRTQGSCASLGLTYAGQKGGYDVLDFRNGKSREFFASPFNLKGIAEIPGVDGIVTNEWRGDFATAHQLLKKVEKGKEYFFSVARHAAIVREGETGLEYLELQTGTRNGWHGLDDGILQYRFGCRRNSKTLWGTLIDVEKLANNSTFAKMLEFINTEASAQVKGVGGYAK